MVVVQPVQRVVMGELCAEFLPTAHFNHPKCLGRFRPDNDLFRFTQQCKAEPEWVTLSTRGCGCRFFQDCPSEVVRF